MTPITVLLLTALVVVPALVTTCALCTRPVRIRRAIGEFDSRVADIAPYLGAVALLSAVKHATSETSQRISDALGWEITGALYAVEGSFVAHLQHAAPDASYAFFSAMYVFGFPYLLTVPAVLYFLLPSRRYFKRLIVAYVFNHLVGLIAYTLFIAYGPRNWTPAHVDGILYQSYPWTQELTAAVSSNTNVFPSLHTSLSVVAMLFAWRTRRRYPRWFYLATFSATSVVLSTMVLGIHWASDIVAGLVLGAGSVVFAERIVRPETGVDPELRDDEPDRSVSSDD